MARPVLPGLLIVAAGILILLSGLVLVGVEGAVGAIGTTVGALTIVFGLLVILVPRGKDAWAFVTMVLGILSIFYALAGFIVGLFLAILGGILAYLWQPPSAGSEPRAS